MSNFNRKEEIKNLPKERLEKVQKYEKDLRGEIRLAELEKEEDKLVNVLLDYYVGRELTDYYRQRYNEQARLVNTLIKNKYVGTDYKKAQEYANLYSKECAILENLKYRFENYQGIARGLVSQKEEADTRIDDKLREKGYLDEMAQAPKKGPKSKKNR